VVINDLYIIGVIALPCKADAPLPVYPDAVLPLSVATQRLQIIGRGDTQRFKDGCGVQHIEFYDRSSLNSLRQLGRKLSVKKLFSFLALEGLDHKFILSRRDIIVKGYCCGGKLVRLWWEKDLSSTGFPQLSARCSGRGMGESRKKDVVHLQVESTCQC